LPGVISNSSPLINLAIIGRLSLLQVLYGKVLVPQAVWREVVEDAQGKRGAEDVERARTEGWIEVVTVRDSPLLPLLRRDLDDGEAEAIAWAIQEAADVILLDESDARDIAAFYALRKTGVVGILMRAKLQGHIASLREELEKLRTSAGFWIANELCQQALVAVGEQDASN